MSRYYVVAAALAGLLAAVPSPARADDPIRDDNDATTAVGRTRATRGTDDVFSTPRVVGGSRSQSATWETQPGILPQAGGGQAAVDPFGNPMIAWTPAQRGESAGSSPSTFDSGLPAPMLEARPSVGPAVKPVQFREAESEDQPADVGAGHSRMPRSIRGEGSVRGRLLHRGRPLVGCRVVLVPVRRDTWGYRFDEESEPLSATTDENGVYLFENVLSGSYKLTWLPRGTRQWIRRIAMKPDVVVFGAESVDVKDIAALRTIN